ncbi:MAG: class I SAM-dependent methyltransferase [Chloroflexota bacterium]
MNSKQPSPQRHPANVYLEAQAYWGMTIHMGGQEATDRLARLCHVDRHTRVLVVGCGVGVTPRYLVRRYGCRVVAIDISEKMVERSKERAKREDVDGGVAFGVADAQALPFADATFDAVMCESVNAFIEDKAAALAEYVRVTKPGGYVGINEVTWLKEPPRELAAYLYRVTGTQFLTGDGWRQLLERSGLRETAALVYGTSITRQWASEVRQSDWSSLLGAWFRYLSMVVRKPAYRRFTREALAFPRSILRLFEYFGYGLYAGRR